MIIECIELLYKTNHLATAIHEIDRHLKNIKKIAKKFGSFVFLLYLCIGNTEVPKTLLLRKENSNKNTKI